MLIAKRLSKRWIDIGAVRLATPNEDDTLEALVEIAAMYCDQLPYEVVEVLHAIPYVEAVHPHAQSKQGQE